MDKFSFLNSAHTSHFAEMYDQYLQSPDSLEPSWKAFFQGFDFGMETSNVTFEEKKFEVGLSTSFNVLEFQEDLAEEQSNEIKAIIDYKKSKNRLRQVKAQTLKENNIQFLEGDER